MKKIVLFLSWMLLLVWCNLNSNNNKNAVMSWKQEKISVITWNGNKFIGFVASWCPHCQEEVPNLQKFYSEYSGKVNMEINVVDRKPFPSVKNLPQNYKNPKSYQDYTHEQCWYVPSWVILDKSGNVIAKKCGWPISEEQLKKYLLWKNDLSSNQNKMTNNEVAKKWDTVYVDYIGFFPDGKVFDTSIEEEAKKAGIYNSARKYEPLKFVVWAWQMIKCFDKAVEWMKIWETKEITCQPNEAYGECSPEKIQKVPKSQLKAFEQAWYKLEKWVELPTQYGMLKIVDVDKDTVSLDFNHPMCGKTLKFKITLRKIEK